MSKPTYSNDQQPSREDQQPHNRQGVIKREAPEAQKGFPTFKDIIDTSSQEYQPLRQLVKNETDAKHIHILMLLLTNNIITKLFIDDIKFLTNEVRNQVDRYQTLPKPKERMQLLIRQRKAERLQSIFNKVNDGLETRLSNDTIQELVDQIVKRNGITSINTIFEFKKLNEETKNALWQAVVTDKPLDQLLKGWTLENQCKEQIMALVECYIPDGDKTLIDEIVKKIIESKDLDNKIVQNHPRLALNNVKKTQLANSIRNIESFQKFCECGGRDTDIIKADFEKWLLDYLSTTSPISSNDVKLKIVDRLSNTPDSRVYDFQEIPNDQKKKLEEELKKSKLFKEHKASIKAQLTLQERKNKAIQYIISNQDLKIEEAEKVTALLKEFKIPDLFKLQIVWRDHVKFHNLIYNDQKTKDYLIAMDQNGKDVCLVEAGLKEKIEELLMKSYVPSHLIDQVVKAILHNGDMQVIEGNKAFSIQLQEQLPRKIEQMQEYIELKELKFEPKGLQMNAFRETLNKIVNLGTARRSYADLLELTKKVIDGKSIEEVSNINELANTDKQLVKRALYDQKQCSNLAKYLKYFGENEQNNVYKLKEALVPTQRDLKINFNLFRTLQSALILNKNMDEIKEHRDLTEFQREKLIDFLKKNDACKKFLDGCKTYQTVEAGLKLKEYISTQLGKIKRKGVMKFLPVIYGAISEYYKIDQSIAHKSYAEQQVSEVLADQDIRGVLQNVENSDQYQHFKSFYAFQNDLKMKMNEDSLKRYFNSLISLYDAKKEDGDDLFKQFKKANFQRGMLQNFKDTDIDKKTITKIASAIEQSSQYQNLINLQEACNVRKELVARSKYVNSIQDIKNEKEMWKLDKETREQLIAGLKDMDSSILVTNTHLTQEQKSSLAGKVLSCEGFQDYINIKDQLEQEDKERAEKYSKQLQELYGKEREVHDKPKLKPESDVNQKQKKSPNTTVPDKKLSVKTPTKDSPKKGRLTATTTATATPTRQVLKDRPFLQRIAAEKGVDYARLESTFKLFSTLKLTAEEISNITDSFRKEYISKLEQEREKMKSEIIDEAEKSTEPKLQLGIFIENAHEELENVKNTIFEKGILEFEASIPARAKARLSEQLKENPRFKRVQQLLEEKKAIV